MTPDDHDSAAPGGRPLGSDLPFGVGPEDPGLDPLDAQRLCCLVGPTAAGKSALALEVAMRAEAEIVSLDSMQVYLGMDIGTAKASAEERARVPQHMLDLVEPSERYDVQRYLRELRQVVSDIHARGRRALFVGGTGFYLAALLRGLFEGPPVDLEIRTRLESRALEEGGAALHAELLRRDARSAARLHPNDTRRLVRALEVLEQTGRTLSDWQREWSAERGVRERAARVVGLALDTPVLDARIRARTAVMLDAGWREEALAVRAGPGFGPTAVQALGYAEVLAWADGEVGRATTLDRIALRTRQFARRQRTWYRKFDMAALAAPIEAQARPAAVDEALRAFGW